MSRHLHRPAAQYDMPALTTFVAGNQPSALMPSAASCRIGSDQWPIVNATLARPVRKCMQQQMGPVWRQVGVACKPWTLISVIKASSRSMTSLSVSLLLESPAVTRLDQVWALTCGPRARLEVTLGLTTHKLDRPAWHGMAWHACSR